MVRRPTDPSLSSRRSVNLDHHEPPRRDEIHIEERRESDSLSSMGPLSKECPYRLRVLLFQRIPNPDLYRSNEDGYTVTVPSVW